MANPAETIDKFNRQRRNLTLAWAALFFYQTTLPSLERVSVGAAGFQLILGRPEYIPFWLSGLLIYFLIRYNQFFNNYYFTSNVPVELIRYQHLVAEYRARKLFTRKILKDNPNLKNNLASVQIERDDTGSEAIWGYQTSRITTREQTRIKTQDIEKLTHRFDGIHLRLVDCNRRFGSNAT